MKFLKFLIASSIIAVASAQNQQVTQAPPTPAPTKQVTPAPTQPTPAPTKQVTPAPTQPTPAPTKQVTPAPTNPTPAPTKQQPTPAPTTSCWDVSLENDATYCIQGPICSGEGAAPAGWNCPKKGDIAVEDCYTYLPSYHGSNCVAPEDAVCKVIKTGAWGCVLPSFPDVVTPAPTVPGGSTTKPTPPVNGSHAGSGGGSHNVTKVPDNDTIQFPTQKAASLSVASAGSVGGVSGALVGVIAAIAGIVCVVAAAVMYRRHQAKKQESGDLESAILSPSYMQQLSAVGSIAPVTPPAGNSKFAPSSTI